MGRRMKFDIKAHLQNHAYYFKEYKGIDKSDLHFNFSFLDIQFFKSGQTPQDTLFELLEELKKPAEYRVRNGYYIDKNGNKKQKYTTRVINLANVVKIVAIHTEGADGEYTMPHIHFILDKNARLGKDFSLLKTHIIEVSKRFGLRPNFAEISQNNPNAYRNLGKAVKNFSWIIRKMPNKDFKKYVANRLEDKLNKLWEYSLLSGNLQYYIKTLNFIKNRLNRQKLEFEYKGHNLRNTYPIPLTQTDIQVIKLINEKKFSQKAIKPYLNNAIMRDFVRYSYFKDKNKALIINSISKQTNLLENLRPNKQVIDNYLKLYQKTLNQDKQQQLQEQQKDQNLQKKSLKINEILIKDLVKIAQKSSNEKELRAGMQKLGYKEFGFKKKSGKVFAYQFKLPNENKKIIVKCSDSIPISEIRAILKENFIKSKKNEKIRADISNEHSQISSYILPKAIETPKTIPIQYKTKQIQKKKEKHKILIKQRRTYANNYKRIRELIRIAKTNANTIARDTSRELEIKRAVTGDAQRERNNQSTITKLATNAGEKLAIIGRTLGRIGEKLASAINTINKFLNAKENKEQKINEILNNEEERELVYRAFFNEIYNFINENFKPEEDKISKYDELFAECLNKKSLEEIEKGIQEQKEKEKLKEIRRKQAKIKQQQNKGWGISR